MTDAAPPPTLALSGVTKRYGSVTAIDALDLTVAAGEVLGLVGPNGAGKTTTLRAIAGIVRPSAGRIAIAGVDLATHPVDAKRRLAFIPDEPHLFDYLTVREHCRFVARLYDVADAEPRIDALLDELELGAKRDALPGELSRGMKQKLAVACALLHDPALLVLDEPLTGLDPVAIRRMKGLVRALAARGTAVILSSHLLTLVEELCDRVLLLRSGRPVAIGSLAELGALRPEFAGRSLEDVFIALVGEDATER
ncbi:MAG: ABC transporter ATP-binding protein [Gemmatimonadaceae bacterium]|jgi:ABC-2 type transport system ATP-binding protein|nr:ABC transporter ATP-binding protein [Gemmatimonadaceae bacterium]